MPLFHIQRDNPGIGKVPQEQLAKKIQNSEAVLTEMRKEGKHIRQVRSFLTPDAIFCVYDTDSEDLIREHSKRSNMVVTTISPALVEVQHDTSGK